MVLIVSIHCAQSMVSCDGFSNWPKVWGKVKACRSWGSVSWCFWHEGWQSPQNFLKDRRKNLFRFSGVVIRVSKFSMMERGVIPFLSCDVVR